MATSDSDFEKERPPRLQDVGVSSVVQVSDDRSSDVVQVSSGCSSPQVSPDSDSIQVFYFSKKMFDFMCAEGTEERIDSEVARKVSDRKGVLLKRKEANQRTKRLREFAEEQGIEKPPGRELAALYRKHYARKRNTDSVMGRSRDSVRRRGAEQLSQSDAEVSSQQQPSSQSLPKKRCRLLFKVSALYLYATSLSRRRKLPMR